MDLVRRASSKGDVDSLYTRVLKPFRHKAGFHVDRGAMSRALGELRDRRFVAFEIDPTSSVLSIPLVTTLMAGMTWSQIRPRPSESEIATLVDEIFEFSTRIRDVAHDYYLLIVKLSTLRESDPSRINDDTDNN